MIPRDKYLRQLIKRLNNGKIKIVTGIRRCGKSVLINEIFYEFLLSQNIAEDHIIPYKNDLGILFIGIKDFLLQKETSFRWDT